MSAVPPKAKVKSGYWHLSQLLSLLFSGAVIAVIAALLFFAFEGSRLE
jgi:hypothetical protein